MRYSLIEIAVIVIMMFLSLTATFIWAWGPVPQIEVSNPPLHGEVYIIIGRHPEKPVQNTNGQD